MRALKLLFVGRLGAAHLREGADHYLERLRRQARVPVEVFEVRDGPAKAQPAERSRQEGEAVLTKVADKDHLICLDEKGRSLTSVKLARKVRDWMEMPGKTPCLVVGGPFGLSPHVRRRADETLALGPMTLPHELARVVLLEQLYRSFAILAGSPYHHG